MANEKNLKPPFSKDSPECSPEIARINGRKGGLKSSKVKKQKKEEQKEKQKFADIFNIILETETKDEELKKKIKEIYPDLKPNNKNLVVIEHFTRMFKKSKEKTTKGKDGEIIITKTKGISDKDFLNFEEFLRDSVGEKPKDDFNFNPNINIIVDSKKKKELMDKI